MNACHTCDLLSLRSSFCLFLSGRFTQVLLYSTPNRDYSQTDNKKSRLMLIGAIKNHNLGRTNGYSTSRVPPGYSII